MRREEEYDEGATCCLVGVCFLYPLRHNAYLLLVLVQQQLLLLLVLLTIGRVVLLLRMLLYDAGMRASKVEEDRHNRKTTFDVLQ